MSILVINRLKRALKNYRTDNTPAQSLKKTAKKLKNKQLKKRNYKKNKRE